MLFSEYDTRPAEATMIMAEVRIADIFAAAIFMNGSSV